MHRSEQEIRRQVLADPNTAKIAESLGVPLGEYVDGVVHFAMNPEAVPAYLAVPDATLQATFGLAPAPSDEELLRRWDEQVAYATLLDRTDFTAATPDPVALSAPHVQASPVAADASLIEELHRQLRTKKGGNV